MGYQLTKEEREFLNSCNMYPILVSGGKEEYIKILTENDEGASLDRDDLKTLIGILIKYTET